MDYVSLHNHTSYSLLDSLILPDELFNRAKELNQSAIGVTDHGTLASAADSLKASRATGVKLMMGCEFNFTDDLKDPSGRLRHIILMAKDAETYRQLLRLHFEAGKNHTVLFKKVVPRIDWKLLEQYGPGMICTTACGGGVLGQLINNKKIPAAKQTAAKLKEIFGDLLALELQPHNMKRISNPYKDYEDQKFLNNQLIKIGREQNIKIIAATNAHYLLPQHHEAHDVELAMQCQQPMYSGQRLKYDNEFFMKSRDEVVDYFDKNFTKEEGEEFCDNTLWFAQQCEEPEWIDPKHSNASGKELPEFPVKDQSDYEEFLVWRSENCPILIEDAAYFRYVCKKGFASRGIDPNDKIYRDRLNEEFDVLEHHGFSSYMLIVMDMLDFCRKNDIKIGPGRGSVGGALSGYLTNIHEADPLIYGLIFERFHTKTKMSFADIDNDIEPFGLEILHNYLKNKYGEENFAKVSNYITISPRPYIKDIAKAFQYGGDHKSALAIGAAISQSVPEDPSDPNTKSVVKALEAFPLLAEYANSPKYKELGLYAKLLDNKPKAFGTHAAGVIIGSRPLVDITPLRIDKQHTVCLEYEKERAEDAGLVKIDTLGLETLAIIRKTHELIKGLGKPLPPSPFPYEMKDQKTYDLISSGDLQGVFQLGQSTGTIGLCKLIKPKCIGDLAIITTLARPAAKDIRSDFIATREGKKKFTLLHPSLEGAFAGTLGFGLYDESILRLGRDVAGWSFNEADRIRKMIKDKGKHPEKVKKLRQEFIDGAVENNSIDRKMATRIWEEEVKKFESYTFNASHAILYSFTSFETAYLKAHFPVEFLVANLMSKVGNTNPKDKAACIKIRREIRSKGIKLLPPDINDSFNTYRIIDSNTIRTGIDSLKFVSDEAVTEIIEKRPFSSFEDFLTRVNPSKVKANAIQALAACGCLDSFGMKRKQMFLYSGDYRKKLQAYEKRKKKTQPFEYPWTDTQEWTASEIYALEQQYLGEALSIDKFAAYGSFFSKNDKKLSSWAETFPDPSNSDGKFPLVQPIKGVIVDFHEFKIKKEGKNLGKEMMKVMLEDPHGTNLVCTVFPEQLKMMKKSIKAFTQGKNQLEVGVGVSVMGELNWWDGAISLIISDVYQAVSPPLPPADLKAQQIKMLRQTKELAPINTINQDDVLEEIEDELAYDGFGDLEDE